MTWVWCQVFWFKESQIGHPMIPLNWDTSFSFLVFTVFETPIWAQNQKWENSFTHIQNDNQASFISWLIRILLIESKRFESMTFLDSVQKLLLLKDVKSFPLKCVKGQSLHKFVLRFKTFNLSHMSLKIQDLATYKSCHQL